MFAFILTFAMTLSAPLQALAAEGITPAEDAVDFVPAEAVEVMPEPEDSESEIAESGTTESGTTEGGDTESAFESGEDSLLKSIPTASPSVVEKEDAGFVLEFTYGAGERQEVYDTYSSYFQDDHTVLLERFLGSYYLDGATDITSDHEEFIQVAKTETDSWTVQLMAPFAGMVKLSVLMDDETSKEIGVRYRNYDKTLYWAYGDGTLKISTKEIEGDWEDAGSGLLSFGFYVSDLPWAPYKNTITQVIVGGEGDTVEPYDTRAWFYSMKNLITADLTHMEGVIGYSMFYECGSLERVELSDHIQSIEEYAFYECGISGIRMPSEVYSIGDEAFYFCGLKTIEIPDGVVKIGRYGFYGNNSRYAAVPDSARWIGGNAFSYSCFNILCSDTAPIVSMPEYADRCVTAEKCNGKAGRNMTYRFDKDTRTLTFSGSGKPDTDFDFFGKYCVKRVCFKEYSSTVIPSFEDYVSLCEITIPEGVTEIGHDAFYGCENLRQITLPESVTEIGYYAFHGCENLQQITLPGKLEKLDNNAFAYCSSLEHIEIPAGVREISSRLCEGCTSLKSAVIPDGLQEINGKAFASCSALQYVTIPVSVYEIDSTAFEHTENVTLQVYSDSYGEEYADTEGIPYEVIGYQISYELDGGVNSLDNPDVYLTEAEDVVLYDATRDGYTFAGWYTDDTYTERIEKIPADSGKNMQLYAKWEAIPYHITYVLDGGTNHELNPATYTVEDREIRLYPPTRPGYSFDGWYRDSELTEYVGWLYPSYPYGDVTLYAAWNVESYRIIYYTNGGENSADNPNWYSVETGDVVLCDATRDGYTFAGWYTDENYTKKIERIPSNSGKEFYLYARWIAIRYAITYKLDGGINNEHNPDHYTYEQNVYLYEPTKKGYSFDGWYLDSGFTSRVDGLYSWERRGSVTVYARWRAQVFYISYHVNGQNHPDNPSEYSAATGDVVLRDPTRYGYRFLGWYTNADYKEKIKKIPADTGRNVDVYAKWEAVQYPITYVLNGGKNNSDNPGWYTVENGSIILLSPYRSGYLFAGWYTDAKFSRTVTWGSVSIGGKTVYAKWIPVTYVVEFNGNGKTSGAMGIQCRIFGKEMKLSSNAFKRTGYTFTGWNTRADGSGEAFSNGTKKEITTADETVVLYAQWKKNTYKITYELNGGKNSSKNPATYTVTTADFTLSKPTKTGYIFAGWYSDSKFTKKATTTIKKGTTGSRTFYAKWSSYTYSISFNANGGKGSMSKLTGIKGTASRTLTANKFTKSGYTFAGWNTKKDGTGTACRNKASVKGLASKNGQTVTLYAQWTVKTYNVAFNANGGTGTMKKLSKVAYGKSKKLTANAYKKTGYTFAGWNTKKDGSGIALADKADIKSLTCPSGSTVTLYAQWTPKEYKITYDLNGGTNSAKNPTSYTIKSSTITLQAPFKSGYTFAGWYSDSKFKTKVTKIAKGSTGSKKFYARWKRDAGYLYFEEKVVNGGIYTLPEADHYRFIPEGLDLTKEMRITSSNEKVAEGFFNQYVYRNRGKYYDPFLYAYQKGEAVITIYSVDTGKKLMQFRVIVPERKEIRAEQYTEKGVQAVRDGDTVLMKDSQSGYAEDHRITLAITNVKLSDIKVEVNALEPSITYYVSENGDRMPLLDLQGKNGGMAYVTISSISHPELKLSFVVVFN